MEFRNDCLGAGVLTVLTVGAREPRPAGACVRSRAPVDAPTSMLARVGGTGCVLSCLGNEEISVWLHLDIAPVVKATSDCRSTGY